VPVPINSDANTPWWQEGAAAILLSVGLFFSRLAKKTYDRRKQEEREATERYIKAAVDKRFNEILATNIREVVYHTVKLEFEDSEKISRLVQRVEHLANKWDDNRDEIINQVERLKRMIRSRHDL